MKFYFVRHNTFYTRGFPWGQKILNRPTPSESCTRCGRQKLDWSFDIDLILMRRKGTRWPAVLGSVGAKFIVCESVLEAWKDEGIGDFPRFRVNICQSLPIKLENTIPPNYFWLYGKKMSGAELDFEASGYVGVHYCPDCGARLEDFTATQKRRLLKKCPYVFVEGSWNGEHLFTTEFTPGSFFCTEKILQCARKYKFTNFRFTPVEEGQAIGNKGVPYSK